ncbi:MAG: arylesterase [Xanthomonadales bacterium]|jgi:acyl-CoA thioesterase-1|nr:arylesterase [Xanthomonadales bacterium]
MPLLRALLLFLIVIWPTAATAAARVLVMGDSLSAGYGLSAEQGWVGLLATALKAEGKDWEVVNASVSGETSAGGAARIGDALARHRPAVVVIALGANDGLRGLGPDLLAANLRRMVRAATASGARVLLVGIRIPPNYGPAYTRAFEGSFASVATELALPLLPFLLEPIAADERWFQSDRLHPTAEAQPLILAHVRTALDPLLEYKP